MKKFLLIIHFFTLTVFAQLQWELISPYPTYADIYDVWTFNDSTVLIVGNSGLCMKTSNGGTLWQNCVINTTNDLKGLYFLNENDGWLFDASCRLYKSTNGGESWELFYSLPQERLITSIYFKDANNGYMGSDYRLYVTTDGGVNWTPKHFNNYIYGFKVFGNSLFCATSATGYVGKLYRSTNNGVTWDTIYSMPGYPVLDFDMNSQGVLICVGKGFAARSTDMGATWVFLAFNYKDFFSVEFLDDSHVFVAGSLNLMSWNSGADWTELTNMGYLKAVSCGENNIVTAGNEGKIFRSTDRGSSWMTMSKRKDNVFRAAFFTSRDTGFLAGEEGTQFIRKTTDGARTWREIPWHHSYYSIGDMTFIEGGAKGFLHARNKIMSSTDYGESWFDVAAPLNSNDNLLKFFFVDDQYGYVLGSNKFILKTTDGGTTWSRNAITATSSLEGLYFVNRDVGFIYGSSGISIYKTSDGGLNWVQKYYDPSGYSKGFNFSSPNEGVCFTSSSDLYTANQGETWTGSTSYVPRILAMDHIDNLNGFASMIHGQTNIHPLMIGITRNGKDWTTKILPLQITGGLMRMADKGTAYLFASDDIIIKLTDSAFTSIEGDADTPGDFTLAQNYPNPFNPTTNIEFRTPIAGEARLIVYDIAGRQLRSEIIQTMAGKNTFRFDGNGLNSGVYFYVLDFGGKREYSKMILLK